MQDSQRILRTLVFWLTATLVFCGTLFWGARMILQTDAKYTAAAAVTRDLGIYAQRIASYTNRIQNAKNVQVFDVNQQMLHALVRKLEMKHLSLSRGNPNMTVNDRSEEAIKGIYYAMPTNLINQVRDLIVQVKALNGLSFKSLQADPSPLQKIKLAANSGFISSITHIIQLYTSEGEGKVARSVFILIGALLAIAIVSVVAYLYVFDAADTVDEHAHSGREDGSVSEVLGGLSVYPGKSNALTDAEAGDAFSPDSIIRN